MGPAAFLVIIPRACCVISMRLTKLFLAVITALAMLSACDNAEKIATRIVEDAADLKVETLQRVDSLLATCGDSTVCLTVSAPMSFGFMFEDSISDTMRTVFDAIEKPYEEYDHNDTASVDKLLLPTLIWMRNNSALFKRGFYDADFNKSALSSEFKISSLKDVQQFLAQFSLNGEKTAIYIPEPALHNMIEQLKKARYLTIVENKYEMTPYNSMMNFTYGAILADVAVYDIETGALVKTTSVFASNSEKVQMGNDKFSDKPLNNDIIFHFNRNMKRELNALSGQTAPAAN